MEYREILSNFEVKKSSRNKAQCMCPNHNDKQASLSVNYNPQTRKTLITCQAGCDTRDVLNQVGLSVTDLFDKSLKRNSQKKKNNNIEKIYKYLSEDGNVLFEKVRTKDKQFFQRRIIDGSTVWGLEEGEYTETFKGSNEFSKKERKTKKKYFPLQKPILYNLPQVIKAVKTDRWVFITEGEKDCETLKSMGFTATTGSNGAGKGKWLDTYGQYFKGATVIILPDNDEPGIRFGKEIKKNIKKYAYSTRLIVLSDIEKGDITDWSKIKGNDRDKLIKIVIDHEEDHPYWYEKNPKNNSVKLIKGILANNLKNNMDYIIASSKGSRGLMHIYKDGVYSLASKNWICSEVSKYIIPRLRSSNVINDVAEMLTYKEPIDFEKVNGNENIINSKNGLYDIKNKELKPHTPKYISYYQLDCEYKKDVKNLGYWDKFINDLSNGNEGITKVLQEYAGLTLSNITGSRAKKVLLLYGKGDTGKSKFIEALCKIAGEENSANLKMQHLSQRFSSSAAYGKRIVFNGDLPNATLEDPSAFKELTGGDTISAEFKGKDQFEFKYKGVLMFACNDLPYIKGDMGNHLFDRFLIVPCNNVIPVEQRDPFLMDKLMEDKNYIFQWALEGLERLLVQDFKFTDVAEMEEQKQEYMIQCDSTRAFISENYTVTGLSTDRIRATTLFMQYENYCNDNERRPCSSQEFAKRLERNLGVIKYKYCGAKYFKGIVKGIIKKSDDSKKTFEEIEMLY